MTEQPTTEELWRDLLSRQHPELVKEVPAMPTRSIQSRRPLRLALVAALAAAVVALTPADALPLPCGQAATGVARAYGSTWASNCYCQYCVVYCRTETGTYKSGGCC